MRRKEFLLSASTTAWSIFLPFRTSINVQWEEGGHQNEIASKAVVPAALTPMDNRGNIDYSGFKDHMSNLVAVEGVSAIMINGGSGHDTTLTRDEKRRLVSIAVEAVDDRIPIIVAVRESDQESRLRMLADDAMKEGATAITMMPPSREMGYSLEIAKKRFDQVCSAVDLPLVIYQTRYETETLVTLSDTYPVVAVKEGSKDPSTFESNMRALRSQHGDIAIWSTHSKWLLADLAIGADGILSGMGSVAAELQVALLRAVQRSDLKKAREINDRLYPLTTALYAPGFDAHVRMKYALVKLGRQQYDYVRPPVKSLDAKERALIDQALRSAGL